MDNKLKRFRNVLTLTVTILLVISCSAPTFKEGVYDIHQQIVSNSCGEQPFYPTNMTWVVSRYEGDDEYDGYYYEEYDGPQKINTGLLRTDCSICEEGQFRGGYRYEGVSVELIGSGLDGEFSATRTSKYSCEGVSCGVRVITGNDVRSCSVVREFEGDLVEL